MIRSIEMMLGLDPMNQFDAVADPMAACFTDEPDLTPYRAVPEQRPARRAEPLGQGDDRRRPLLAGEDPGARLEPHRRPRPLLAEPDQLVQPLQGLAPYPAREGEAPGQAEATTTTIDPRAPGLIPSPLAGGARVGVSGTASPAGGRAGRSAVRRAAAACVVLSFPVQAPALPSRRQAR